MHQFPLPLAFAYFTLQLFIAIAEMTRVHTTLLLLNTLFDNNNNNNNNNNMRLLRHDSRTSIQYILRTKIWNIVHS